jgi:tRNA pseudouridine55 synthase
MPKPPKPSKPSKPRSSPRRSERLLDGLLLLDKPAGLSSNQALQRVRHLFSAAKAGHTGSLDPLATGLLPVCFGEATKIAGGLLGARKAYETVARLGITTDSDDADGAPLVVRDVPALDIARIEAALAALRGRIRQRPPLYSALKQGGEPLYAKARRGERIEVPEREVDVHGFELRNAADLLDAGAPLLRLHVECGSGTYVRSLVRDLGEALGCGAHVVELRRTWVDPFRDPRMWSFDELERLATRGGQHALDACLLPIEAGMARWPRVVLDPPALLRLARGQAVALASAPQGEVAVYAADGRIAGLAEGDAEGRLSPRRIFRWAAEQARPDRDPGTATTGPG